MLRRRRGSVSTHRSGPSLFGLLVLGSPRPGGQPKSQKAFWAACLDLGSFRRAAPRAVGSRSRVGLLARPSAAVASAGVRARGSRHAALCVWWAFAPARRERPREACWWVPRIPLCVVCGRTRCCFEASESTRDYSLGVSSRLLCLLGTLRASSDTEKPIASKLIPRSTTNQLRRA